MLEDLTDYCASLGLGTVGTDLFDKFMPEKPDNCACIKATGGPAPDKYLPTYVPTFQVLIRNGDYAAGEALMMAFRDSLHRKSGISQGSTYFYAISLISEGGSIGGDSENRELFSLNFQCKARQLNPTN